MTIFSQIALDAGSTLPLLENVMKKAKYGINVYGLAPYC
jgi:hypothetical protein